MISKDFFLALDELEVQKKINKEQLIEILETALTSVYKKEYGEGEGKNAVVKLNSEKNSISVYSYKKVVEEVEDPNKEISLTDAKAIKKSYEIGDNVVTEESPKNFGRIAVQTGRQVIMQRLKELEKQRALEELSEKEDELLTTVVKRIDNGVIYVQIPGSHSEGVMLETDQIPGEKFKEGDRIKVYVKKIKESFRGPQIQVSRSNIGFVRKLFELEIPEVTNGDVIIKNIARDPGGRTKVAVYTEKQNIDPVGSCVGNRGVRINTVVGELNGEKIDLVLYSPDPLEYIARALSPAKIISVETNESLKASRVIVPDDKLSLAIGKNGQNVRLAARLTGWKIEVKPESEVNKIDEKPIEVEYELTELPEEETETFDSFEGFDEIEEDKDSK